MIYLLPYKLYGPENFLGKIIPVKNQFKYYNKYMNSKRQKLF
jgi:hypothetical protein